MFDKEKALLEYQQNHPGSLGSLTAKCNVNECDRLGSSCRGLCATHYILTLKLLKEGKCTKEELEEKKIYNKRLRQTAGSTKSSQILRQLGKA